MTRGLLPIDLRRRIWQNLLNRALFFRWVRARSGLNISDETWYGISVYTEWKYTIWRRSPPSWDLPESIFWTPKSPKPCTTSTDFHASFSRIERFRPENHLPTRSHIRGDHLQMYPEQVRYSEFGSRASSRRLSPDKKLSQNWNARISSRATPHYWNNNTARIIRAV